MKNVKPTIEQQNIIKNINNKNIICNCIAGSGKTSTAFFISEQYPQKSILLLTYSSILKTEARKKIKKNIFNIEIHSFHSFVNKYYKKCFEDNVIHYVIKYDKKSKYFKSYDIIIIDEAQDLTKLYYLLFKKICLEFTNKNFTFALFGDIRQSIYEFKGSNIKYFLEYKKKFKNINKKKFVEFPLTESFRVTDKIADFINQSMLNEKYIISNKKSNTLVTYYESNAFDKKLFAFLYDKIKKYSDNDIFILSRSIKSDNKKTPIKVFEHILVKLGRKIYFPYSESEEIKNIKVIKNKIVFSTFHGSKGLERKLVILFDFDEFKKTEIVCPNILYVATSRATEELICIASNTKLSFLNLEKNTCNIIKNESYNPKPYIPINKITSFNISTLAKNVDYITLEKFMKYIIIISEEIFSNNNKFNLEKYQKQSSNIYEDVSSIIGSTILIYYQYYWLKNIKIDKNKIKKNILNYIENQYNLKHVKKQIKNPWINIDQLNIISKRLDSLLNIKKCKFEKLVELCTSDYIIKGYIDCLEEKTIIWEFKLSEFLRNIAICQALFYFIILNHKKPNKYKECLIKIYFIEENKLLTLSVNNSDIQKVKNIFFEYINNLLKKNIN